MPVKRAWVEAVAGRKVLVTDILAEDVATFASLRPTAAEVPEAVAGQDGTVLAGGQSVGESEAFSQPGLYPPEPARVVSTGFQGEIKKAEVELASLRWDPGASRLVLAKRLLVRLEFKGREAGEDYPPTRCD